MTKKISCTTKKLKISMQRAYSRPIGLLLKSLEKSVHTLLSSERLAGTASGRDCCDSVTV